MEKIDGIPFECIKCGKCCKWEGYVFVDEKDIDRIAKHFKMSNEDWVKENTKDVKNKLALKDKENSNDCIYLKDNKCSIFDVKPRQCNEYPISYDKRCPGFNKDRSEPMESKYADLVNKINKKFSYLQEYEKTVSDNLYKELQNSYDAAKVASTAIEEGIDDYFNPERIKVSSLDDLFGFNRVDAGTLIHKSSKDLWRIEENGKGEVHITRLFNDNGEPIKG